MKLSFRKWKNMLKEKARRKMKEKREGERDLEDWLPVLQMGR